MTDLTPTEPSPMPPSTAYDVSTDLAAWAGAMGDAMTLAKGLAGTAFVPSHFQGKPADTAVAIMKGAALGLDPVAALEAIYVISGKPALYARSMVALVLARGHEVWTEEADATKVTVKGRRHGSSHVEESTWDVARVKAAGLDRNRQYAAHPEAMLYARAAADVCRRIAPDVLAGLSYGVEELQEPAVEAAATIQRKIKPHQKEGEPHE
nr:MAG TPA: RecT protein [Caudoviricetes sp.]